MGDGRGLLIVLAMLCSSPAAAQERWVAYTDPSGTSIDYPADIFSVRTKAESGEAFTTRDGRARIHMYSMANRMALTPRQYMRQHFPASRSILTYDRVAKTFFAISTRRNGMIVYVRCNFSRSRGATLHCVELGYPEREKAAWDGIVTRVSRSVRPLTRS
jgi:hypothetical protein